MDDSPLGLIKHHVRVNHQRVLTRTEDLNADQLAWHPESNAPSIGFHLWHIARWADLLLEILQGPGSQLWDKENLSERWGLNVKELGLAESGTSMDDEGLARLSLSKNDMIDYARRVFAAVEDAVEALTDEDFRSMYAGSRTQDWWHGRTIGYSLMVHLTHEIRHCGMIEGLRGAQGADVNDDPRLTPTESE